MQGSYFTYHDALWSGREEKPYSWSYRGTTVAWESSGSGTQFSAAGAFLPASWETQDRIIVHHFYILMSLSLFVVSVFPIDIKGKWGGKRRILYIIVQEPRIKQISNL